MEFKKSTNEITKDVYDIVGLFSNRDGGIIILSYSNFFGGLDCSGKGWATGLNPSDACGQDYGKDGELQNDCK